MNAPGLPPIERELGVLFRRLRELGIDCELQGNPELRVCGIGHDSRCISKGEIFLALPGTQVDGASYIEAALHGGAVAVLCDRRAYQSAALSVAAPRPPTSRHSEAETPALPHRQGEAPTLRDTGARPAASSGAGAAVSRLAGSPGVSSRVVAGQAAVLLVEDVEAAAGVLAALFYGEPSAAMDLVGVTGTNGKTSCTYILESIWRAAGREPGIAGTITQRCRAFTETAKMTTPPAADIQALLARMLAAGCDCVAMEVSSHALAQQRVSGCRFKAGIFTNLTRDHLDYHGDEAAYFAAKASLFRRYLDYPGAVAVLNADDRQVAGLAAELCEAEVWTYSTARGPFSRPRGGRAARVKDAQLDLYGIRAELLLGEARVEFSSALVGEVNLSNMLACAAAAHAMGVAPELIGRGLGACKTIPGRLQRIDAEARVFIDYAHTPDALRRALSSLRPWVRGRLIVVFGCGGDRDRGKRKLMGQAAAAGADLAVLTSDNPRSEDPELIIEEIKQGMFGLEQYDGVEALSAQTRGYVVEVEREPAIEAALRLAGDGDVVLVAGKGHETYQEGAQGRIDFDDRLVVEKLLGLK